MHAGGNWEHVRAWERRSAFAKTRSRHSLPVLLRVRGVAGTFVGESGKAVVAARTTGAYGESFSGGTSSSVSKIVCAEVLLVRRQFSERLGGNTYTVQIVLECAMMGGE